jgi:hypothetical protein
VCCGLCAPSAASSLPSPSPLPLFLILLAEVDGAITSNQALWSLKLQVLMARDSPCIGEKG